jgi:hypothetical protein
MPESGPVDRHRFRRRVVQMFFLGLSVGAIAVSIALYWLLSTTRVDSLQSSALSNNSENDQSTYQTVIKDERQALIRGTLVTPRNVKAEADRSAKFAAVVCGPSAHNRGLPFCGFVLPPAASGSSEPVVDETWAGSRIKVKAAVDADAEVTQLSGDVQPVIEPADAAMWTWNIKPKETGRFSITLTLTTLRQDKDEPLLPDRTVTIPLEVSLTITHGVKSTSGSLAIWIPIVVSVLTLFGLGEFLRRRRTGRSESGADQGSTASNSPHSRPRTKRGKPRRR